MRGGASGRLFSSLRLGFLVLPSAFVESAAAALSITQRYHPVMEQAILTDFIEQGHFERHVQRMREVCAERREVLVEAARTELGGLMEFSDSQLGWQLIGWLAPGMSDVEARQRAVARHIESVALTSLTIEQRMPPGLVFGIGAADARAIRTAIRRLGRVLRVLAWQTKGSAGIRENAQPPGAWHPFPEPRSSHSSSAAIEAMR